MIYDSMLSVTSVLSLAQPALTSTPPKEGLHKWGAAAHRGLASARQGRNDDSDANVNAG
jgi:hypothetical protein